MGNAINIFVFVLTLQSNIYFESDNLPHNLAVTISQAEHSLDIAFHQFYHPEVLDSLISAYNRGVRVRIITEHDYIWRLQSLINMGIPVIDEGFGQNDTAHRMHNKFVVIDFWDSDTTNDMVWTGSYNASSALHADNAVLIRSHSVASAFESEFNQMWGDTGLVPDPSNSRFGDRKTDVLPSHVFSVNGTTVEVYFSPQDNPIDRLSHIVADSDSLIDFCIYFFTNYGLRDAMVDALGRSVMVRGVFDRRSMDWNAQVFNRLAQNGAEVYWDSLPPSYYYLHHKFMVIDDSIVITGSMNWTYSGTAINDENVIVIYNAEIADEYENEFAARFTEAGGNLDIEENPEGSRDATGTVLKASPNPFTGTIRFNLPNVLIYDVLGRRVGMADGFEFDGSKLPKGLYFAVKDGRWLRIEKL